MAETEAANSAYLANAVLPRIVPDKWVLIEQQEQVIFRSRKAGLYFVEMVLPVVTIDEIFE